MTENEAIKELKDYVAENDKLAISIETVTLARKALEEIQSYKAIGTVEELQSMKEHGAFTGTELAQIAVCQMELQKYMAIGTIEEFKALKEKSVAKKPNQISKALDGTKFVGLIGRCPNCGHIVAEDNFVCEDCFQVLDWSE